MPSIVVDSRTNLELTWNPTTILPSEDPNSFTVDITVYSYDYNSKRWDLQSRKTDIPNNGHTLFGVARFNKEIRASCIHIAVREFIQPSIDNSVQQVIKALSSMSGLPFPSQVGIWSGLLFTIRNERSLKEKEAEMYRNMKYRQTCSVWRTLEGPMPLDDVVDSLPACPPTQERARLPNSGLEEVNYESKLYSTHYHNQWMKLFNPDASKCFVQAIVTRYS